MPSLHKRYLYPPFLLLLAASRGTAVLQTVTVDDQIGDSRTGALPRYDPAGDWTQGASCNDCNVHPNPSQAFDGSWHAVTQLPGDSVKTVTVDFTGTAVNVFNIIANNNPNALTRTSIEFLIDNILYPPYVHNPDPNSSDIQYNVLVFSKSGLTNTPHTIIMRTTTTADGGGGSLCMFDYIQYSFDDGTDPAPPSTSSTSMSTATSTRTTTVTTSAPTQSSADPSSSSSNPSAPITSPSSPSHSSSSSPPSTPSNSSKSPSSSQATSGSPSIVASSPPPAPNSPQSTVTENPQTTPTVSISADVAQHRSSFPKAAAVGAALGGVVSLAVLIFLCCLHRRRRGQRLSPFPLTEIEKADALASEAGENSPAVSRNAVASKGGEFYTSPSQTALMEVKDTPPHANAFSESEYSSEPEPTNFDSITQGYGFSTARPLIFDSLRPPLPAVVPGPESSTTPTTDVRDSQYTNLPSASVAHGTYVEKSEFESSAASPFSDPGLEGPSPPLPTPPSHLLEPRIMSSPSMSESATSHVTVLRTQVAVLQEELARMREEQDIQRILDEAPPTYDEARTERLPMPYF